ncbi:MAG: protein translocase SEC61 complex subunit gamma, partial [Thermoplasmatota archaeon]
MSERSFMDKAWDTQRKIEKRMDRIGKGKYARVLRMARKPEPEEFKRSSSIVLVGIAVIGGIGFIIYLLMELLIGALGRIGFLFRVGNHLAEMV